MLPCVRPHTSKITSVFSLIRKCSALNRSFSCNHWRFNGPLTELDILHVPTVWRCTGTHREHNLSNIRVLPDDTCHVSFRHRIQYPEILWHSQRVAVCPVDTNQAMISGWQAVVQTLGSILGRIVSITDTFNDNVSITCGLVFRSLWGVKFHKKQWIF